MENNYPRTTEILRGVGLIDMSHVPQGILERALKFGTACHKTTELWDLKTLNLSILDKNLLPYLESWRSFLSDYGVTIEKDEIERQFISERYRFKGTPDRWPIVKGKRTLIDLKSSTTMTPVTGIQLAGYEILLDEAGIKVKQRWGVQLTDHGYKVFPYDDPLDRAAFLGALSLYNWKRRNL